MKFRCSSTPMVHLVTGVSVLGLLVSACNKQPDTPATPTVAPPIAALPLVAGVAPTAASAPAPMVTALPPPATQIRYAPAPRGDRYRYIDRAYSMGQAFAETPPDYAVDYQGTRPWIWRAGDGAYRIVERLPRGERVYYYDAGQDYPFLVRDPDYSYAYDGDGLAGVYGPDGAEINDAIAAQRAYEASRYLDRARALYRAAQYERRQSAYANEWASRRDQLRSNDMIWEQQQGRNADWRSWHDQHQSEESRQWQQERNQRIAYAAAIGLAVTAAAGRGSASNPPRQNADPAEVARRQATYFASWNAAHGRGPAGSTATTQSNTGGTSTASTPPARVNHVPPPIQQATVVQPSGTVSKPVPVAPAQQSTLGAKQREAAAAQVAAAQAATNAKQREAAAAQAKAAQAAQAQKSAAEAKQREAAIAQAKTTQAAQAQKLANEAKQREASAAQTRATQAAQAQKLASEAKQREAAAAQAKAAQADQARRLTSETKQREAAAAQARAAQAAQAQKSVAEMKQRQAAAAEAKAAQAAQVQKQAGEARQREAAAAQAKASQAAQAEKLAAQARQREAAAAQTKAAETAHAQQAADEAKHQKAAAATASPNKPAAKRKGEPPKDQPTPQQQ